MSKLKYFLSQFKPLKGRYDFPLKTISDCCGAKTYRSCLRGYDDPGLLTCRWCSRWCNAKELLLDPQHIEQ